MKGSHVKRVLGGTIGVLLLFGILVAVNAAVSALRLRADLTEGKVYTLSQGTEEVLAGLPREVTLKFYVSRGDENAPLFLKQYAQRIADLLQEYELKGGGRVAVETYDPLPDSDEEEWAQRYGLTPRSFGTLGAAPDFYLGLVAVSGAQEAAIPFITPAAEPQ
ncbi:MAG: GldG family protein, partial [Candidatus Aureabacteria bacterium]|nr:GldG family protein [Candidatus Auribacterota bacterium]